jgi:hypothetical protein
MSGNRSAVSRLSISTASNPELGAAVDDGADDVEDLGASVCGRGVEDVFVGPIGVDDQVTGGVVEQEVRRGRAKVRRLVGLGLEAVDVADRVRPSQGCSTGISDHDIDTALLIRQRVIGSAELVVESS